MARILPALLLSGYSLAALAQEKAKDAPVEKADPIVIVAFLVLFIGSCVGYVGWLVYTKGKQAKTDAAGEPDPR